MTEHLVIGGAGLIGTAVVAELRRLKDSVVFTTRKGGDIPFELGQDSADVLDVASTVYLIAAVPNFERCERDPMAWRINVDAQIEIARKMSKAGAFVVFISSDAVEWCGGTALARQKAQVEAYINAIDGAIVRPSRVTAGTVADFAASVCCIGAARVPGVFRWKA